MSQTTISPDEVPVVETATRPASSRSGRRVLGQALMLWWMATVLGSVGSAAPLLPWFEVLANAPFTSVMDDIGLLHERVFSAATTAHLLPIDALFQATLQQLLLWRVMLIVPMGIVMCASVSPQRSLASAAVKTVLVLPRFFVLGLLLQTLAASVTGLGLGYAWSWLGRAEASAFELGVGIVVTLLSLTLGLGCLTLLELSRIALFERPDPFTPTRTSGRTTWSTLLDGLDQLRRQPVASMGMLGGYFALGTAASLAMTAAGTAVAAWAPEGLGQGVSWLLVQMGVALSLCCRALGWRKAQRILHVG
jgi:hypothetical protein